MLKWYDNLYIGEGISDAEKIQARLNENRLTLGIYLLTLSDHPKHLMEILPAASLKQKRVRELCPAIFGMAGSKEDAIDLACSILKTVYDATGDFGIEDYLKNR